VGRVHGPADRRRALTTPSDLSTPVSASCTTSWLDWIHGELWLCPTGLLRRSLGLRATFAHGTKATVDPLARPTRIFDAAEIAVILAAGRRNRWIPWSSVTQATLKRGTVTSSLHLELGVARKEKFLWLPVDRGFEFLSDALPRLLPVRFRAVRSPHFAKCPPEER